MTTQGQDVNLMPWMNACAYKRDDYSWAKVIDELWFKKREKHDFLWNNCYEMHNWKRGGLERKSICLEIIDCNKKNWIWKFKNPKRENIIFENLILKKLLVFKIWKEKK